MLKLWDTIWILLKHILISLIKFDFSQNSSKFCLGFVYSWSTVLEISTEYLVNKETIEMSRFTQSNRGVSVVSTHERGRAYRIDSPEFELYTIVATSVLLGNKFYESLGTTIVRIRQLVRSCDPAFVGALAVYARNKMYARTIPLVLVVELARIHNGDSLVSNTTSRVVQRPDEIYELLGAYEMANARKGVKRLNKLSHQITKGLETAFNNFDEYQFAKWNRTDRHPNLKDALKLVRPTPVTPENARLFNAIKYDSLATPYTWETQLSQKGVSKKTVWEELITSRKVGYQALLMNLRNILEAGVSVDHIQIVTNYLSNDLAVANARQLPHKYLAAYNAVVGVTSPHTSLVLDALEQAVQKSVQHIPLFSPSISIGMFCDFSGSMHSELGFKFKLKGHELVWANQYKMDPRWSKNDLNVLQQKHVGALLAMLLRQRCRSVVTGAFGTRCEARTFPTGNALAATRSITGPDMQQSVGYGTDIPSVVNYLIANNLILDKVMLFTDCQTVGNTAEAWSRYKRIAPNAKLYVFDLTGYGNTPLSLYKEDFVFISGWSDQVFSMLHAIENGSSVIEQIMNESQKLVRGETLFA